MFHTAREVLLPPSVIPAQAGIHSRAKLQDPDVECGCGPRPEFILSCEAGANPAEDVSLRRLALDTLRLLIRVDDLARAKELIENDPALVPCIEKYKNHLDDLRLRLFALEQMTRLRGDKPGLQIGFPPKFYETVSEYEQIQKVLDFRLSW